jgi:hypothetical protein
MATDYLYNFICHSKWEQLQGVYPQNHTQLSFSHHEDGGGHGCNEGTTVTQLSPLTAIHKVEPKLRCGNDPSAGSPTETLLRLHLPLNDKVQTSSRNHNQ